MVFDATFNDISVILWWLVLLVEETRVPGANHRHVANHLHILSHNVVSSTPHHEQGSNSQLYWRNQTIIQSRVPIKVGKVRSSYTILWKTE